MKSDTCFSKKTGVSLSFYRTESEAISSAAHERPTRGALFFFVSVKTAKRRGFATSRKAKFQAVFSHS